MLYRKSSGVLLCFFLIGLVSNSWFHPELVAQTLEEQLVSEDPAALAKEVLKKGKVNAGANLFANPKLTCIQCHNHTDDELAPSLSIPTTPIESPEQNVEFLINSILDPSKHIAKKYQTGVFLTLDGDVITGIVKEVPNKGKGPATTSYKILVSGDQPKIQTIDEEDIDSWEHSSISSMPKGLVNNLKDRKQFLDLVRYLHHIQMKGPNAQLRLHPMSVFFPVSTRKAYEANIDHAGLIGELGKKEFQRGKKIFHQHCASCHGEVGKEGLMPTSLRFDIGKFKNGSDPFSLYQTLTDGFGLMTAQQQLVPTQKYAVIHYIREHYVRNHNAGQYQEVSKKYLDSLPKGTSRGPERKPGRRWLQMDYGDHLINTLEVGNDGSNIAQKGIAIRLDQGEGGVAKGNYWALFEHDTLRLAAVWKHRPKDKHRFIDWNGIHFNDRHAVHPKIAGDIILQNKTAPGWANPKDNSFVDNRVEGRDGKRYGPLSKEWGRFLGVDKTGGKTKILYRVGESEVKESYGLQESGKTFWVRRSIEIDNPKSDLELQLAHLEGASLEQADSKSGKFFRLKSSDGKQLVFALLGQKENVDVYKKESELRVKVGRTASSNLQFYFANLGKGDDWKSELQKLTSIVENSNLAKGKEAQKESSYDKSVVTSSITGGFEVRTFQLPEKNQWNDRLRLTGLDFLPNPDQMVVCCWDGTVWRVDGLLSEKDRFNPLDLMKPIGPSGLFRPADGPTKAGGTPDLSKEVEARRRLQGSPYQVKWTRIAEGLFQPLGIKVRDGKIFVACRDQIVQLVDRDGDGKTDFYKNFNSDHQVTEHFHEFAMGLQADKEGNFYYAKSARHAKKALVPHHGTLLKVSKDGSKTEIIAKGFRAANGVCINPDGSFIVTDQEGHWNPKNRINWVTKDGFYGNMWGYHDVTDKSDDAMVPPLCWITNKFDRSPGELLWCGSVEWGDLADHFFNLSYGEGRIYMVLPQKVGSSIHGGMVPLPIPAFPTGVMRGRLHPTTGDLYCCGMYAWGGNRQKPGGLYRVRRTGIPVDVPIDLQVHKGEIQLSFSLNLDERSATDPRNYSVRMWSLRRSARYGSPHIDPVNLGVESVELLSDRKTVRLKLKGLRPTMGMEIRYSIRSQDRLPMFNLIHNTIHEIEERKK